MPGREPGIFGDVPASDPFAPWIEQIYAEAITGGGSASPLLYCPAPDRYTAAGETVLAGSLSSGSRFMGLTPAWLK